MTLINWIGILMLAGVFIGMFAWAVKLTGLKEAAKTWAAAILGAATIILGMMLAMK